MAAVEDILFDDTGDLAWVDGDLVWDESDEQHIQDILTASPGAYTLYPLIGCNIRSQVNGKMGNEFVHKVQSQLISDGYHANSVTVAGDQLNIDAERRSGNQPTISESTAINLSITTLNAITYTSLHDWVAPYSYCGVAILGTPESAAGWKITRIEVFLNGSTETKQANNVRWTERQTINYT